ncbi:MAG: double-strand break repair protein AddB, partial [Alphaproteobacteria bacterium]
MSAALPSPRVFSIAAGLPFADALAAGLLARAGRDPLQLARMLVLLPTRRACRSVREAFLRLTDGKPLLLPRLQPIGDIDDEETTLQAEPGVGADAETPPAIESLRRQMLLARRIMADADKSAEQAAYLAAALAELLDQLQTERVPFASLAGLVPDELAEHWQRTLEFLAILTDDWPRLIAAEHAVDPAARRDRLLGAQARRWRERPPDFPVFAAGSTGTIPATADLLAAIAGLPDGAVVLPGLDRNLDDAAWDTLEPTHPQFGMSRLLAHLGVARTQVVDWPLPEASATPDAIGAARAVLVNEALRPAESTDRWRDADHAKAALEPAFATPLVYVECPTPREEAGVIALAMREALEVAGRTAALITPDRQLARRVAAELRRWNVEIDDSAGTPLGSTPPGAFLRLIAQAAAADWSPVALLATLKHPLASLGAAQGAFRARVRALELAVVRGPRPAPGFAGLLARLEQSVAEGDLTPARAAPLAEFLDRLRAAAAPLDALMVAREATLPALVRAHVVVAETLAQSSDGRGADRLWAGDNGESAGRYVADLAAAAADFPAIPPRQYADQFAGFMVGTNV